ncbi:MAG: YgjP-like metallopeptidase domain-containing protein [Prolixibacteraceae bacterium]
MNEKTLYVSGIGEVQMVRKARSRRLRISVKSSGEVLVTIPWLFSFSRGESFLEEKKSWVIKALQKIQKHGLTRIPLQPGELFSTRSLKYMLLPIKSERVKVQLKQEEQTVVIGYPEKASLEDPEMREKIRLAVDGVLRYEAKRYLPIRVRELANQLGYSFRAVTIKNNKTNWGSCSSLKNINLNLHLMRLPDRLIDLILVHELVHTKIPNHGPLFKAQLKHHFPDVDELNKVIKKFRPELF